MPFWRSLLASALLILGMILGNYLEAVEDLQPIKPLATFPKKIGEWTGQEARFSEKIYEVLGVSDSFLGSYKNDSGSQIQLYIGYYQSQRRGQAIHSPKNCLPGAGWNIVGASIEEMTIPEMNPVKVPVNKLIVEKGNQRQVVFYWFQSRSRFVASEYKEKFYLIVDSLTKHRTDGSFIQIMTPISPEGERGSDTHLKGFAQLLVPLLQKYIPS